MSNPAPAQNNNKTAPVCATPDRPPGYDVRIKKVTFVSKMLPMQGPNSGVDSIGARAKDAPNGTDIYWSPTERHYWFGRYNNNELIAEFEMADDRVEFRERW